MRHPALLDRNRAALAVIDMQEGFRPMIAGFGEVAARIALMTESCHTLGVPVVVTEQYPKGLGHTASEIAATLPAGLTPVEKKCFSSCGVQDFDLWLRERHVEQVMLCGIEAHICVSQTAHDLLQLGYQVHVISDAVATRLPHNREVAINKMSRAGVIVSSVEMSLFELLRTAEAAEFKTIQRLVMRQT
ncbi:MAG TPA: isochorismatase family protein [Blastocatellia bacterium]|nr:isochorismatase family protein [Blastocatellia bacterium]